MSLRILHVIQELQPGGAERVLVSIASGAERAGHEVAVAAVPGPLARELSRPPFPLPLVRRRPWRLVAATASVRRTIREWRPDLVHAHNPAMAAASAAATRRGRRLRAVVSFHGVPEEDYAAAARLLRWSGLPVIACGPGVEAGLVERGCRVLGTILNGVGPPAPPADRTELARELGIPADGALVVGVGRLVPQKSFSLAVRALADVSHATLVVLGEGPLRAELERESQDAGVADRVVLAGVRPDARAIIGAADAVVIPSLWEGLPLVALEALAAGTPVVATGARGLRELLVHEESALLVPVGDIDALAAALGRVLADEPLAGRLREGGRRVAEAHSEDAMVSAYLELYARVAGSDG